MDNYNNRTTNSNKRFNNSNSSNKPQKPKNQRKLDAHETELLRFKRDDVMVRIITNNGILQGKIAEFDRFAVSVNTEYGRRTVFKHAIVEFGDYKSY